VKFGLARIAAFLCSAYILMAGPSLALAVEPLIVATKETPPFVMFEAPGRPPVGLTASLVEAVAQSLHRPVEWRRMTTEQMIESVAAGEVDMAAAALTVTEDRERRMDFSSAYFSTGLGIAIRPESDTILSTARALMSPAFLQAVGSLAATLMVVGLVIWLLERRRNHEHFGGGLLGGIGNGFWWSAVTMATVGYGDKVPRTPVGRVLGILWMFASVILISSFTASVASGLTVSRLAGAVRGPHDLPKVISGAVAGSAGAKYAGSHKLRHRKYPDLRAALDALAEGEVDAVVYDLAPLRYGVAKRGGEDIAVLDAVFEQQNYVLALPLGRATRKDINVAMLNFMTSPRWQEDVARWLPDN
jgi:polar amino acid transport system substrate-binding protein